MPRRKRGFEDRHRPIDPDLVSALVDELAHDRAAGQPLIDEQRFPESGLIRVVVIWDRWESIPDDVRSETILEAYELAEGPEYKDRISVAIGLTFPEAIETGYLPYKVIPLVRGDGTVGLDQCRQAMIDEGASILMDERKPQLRFITIEDAKACVDRLVARLPGSESVWTIAQEVNRIAD